MVSIIQHHCWWLAFSVFATYARQMGIGSFSSCLIFLCNSWSCFSIYLVGPLCYVYLAELEPHSKNSLCFQARAGHRETCMRFGKQKRSTSHLDALKLGVEPDVAAASSGCRSAGSPCWPRAPSAPASFSEAKCVGRSAYPVSLFYGGHKKQARVPICSCSTHFTASTHFIIPSWLLALLTQAQEHTQRQWPYVDCLTHSHDCIYGRNNNHP